MSFYSYKNSDGSCACPGTMNCGNAINGLSERICVQVKNVYDSCISQEQLSDRTITVSNIVPIVNPGCANGLPGNANVPCRCNCSGNACNCNCRSCNAPISHEQAVENAESSPCPLPTPVGNWTFESCRSSTTRGEITDLTIDRLCDRPQFARVRANIAVPIDVLFIDARCQEWMGQATITVAKDVLLAIPDESIVPFTLESLVSAICVSGSYIGDCQFKIDICVTIVLKILAEVEVMIPSYGFCQIPPSEEFSENVCDEFFSLPLFPQSTATAATANAASGSTATAGCGCGCASLLGTGAGCSTCSSCGTTCGGSCATCPRCGSTMTASS
ncbi:MAG: hypothetical protein Q4A66_04080 [Eubacteriales bacterium]|nr:hypothetical protein [Eubacteriales bacterium]